MAGNVPASLLTDLHAIVTSSCDALDQGVAGNLKQVRARLMECQIAVQAVLEESTLLLRDEERARVLTDAPAQVLPRALSP